jgi:acyl-CoA synthetase (AMP-forming)/AMP-acid ligase II
LKQENEFMAEAPLIVRGGLVVKPQEVERALLKHPAVAEVAVVGLPDRPWDEVIAAAVRLSGPLPAAVADLTEHCRARLAPYKIPVRWLFTSSLPHTPDGEICRLTITAQAATLSSLDEAVFQQRAATEDLQIPLQLRRSVAPDDLD